MTQAIIKNVKIEGISTVVGDITEKIEDLYPFFNDKRKFDRLKTTINLKQIAKVDKETTEL